MARPWLLGILVLWCAGPGCGRIGYDLTGRDAGLDPGPDAGVDAARDAGAGVDAGADAGVDVGLDAGPDAGVDAGRDAGLDPGPDAGVDAGRDAGLDPGPDAGVDAGPPPPPCVESCFVDVSAGTHTCSTTTRVTVESLAGGRGTATLDVSGTRGVLFNLEHCDADGGFTFHLGDSPSNDGFGGDLGDRSNDAELHTWNGNLEIWGNDYGGGAMLDGVVGFVPRPECTTDLFLEVQDARVFYPLGRLDSPFALRIDPITDDQGPPDGIWYLGLNRTYADPTRTGRGLNGVQICIMP